MKTLLTFAVLILAGASAPAQTNVAPAVETLVKVKKITYQEWQPTFAIPMPTGAVDQYYELIEFRAYLDLEQGRKIWSTNTVRTARIVVVHIPAHPYPVFKPK